MSESPPSTPPNQLNPNPVDNSTKQATGAMEEYYTKMRDIDGQYMEQLVNNSHASNIGYRN